MTDPAVLWRGAFGRRYTLRNRQTPSEYDQRIAERLGVTASETLRRILDGREIASALEVGCNEGLTLRLLRRVRPATRVVGVDVQEYALRVARCGDGQLSMVAGLATALPFRDRSFDLVYTAGTLIHIPPADMPATLVELARCSRRYLLGWEYYAHASTEVTYHGQRGVLWKQDFAALVARTCPDFRLLASRLLPDPSGLRPFAPLRAGPQGRSLSERALDDEPLQDQVFLFERTCPR